MAEETIVGTTAPGAGPGFIGAATPGAAALAGAVELAGTAGTAAGTVLETVAIMTVDIMAVDAVVTEPTTTALN
jgi:hypothetical protein